MDFEEMLREFLEENPGLPELPENVGTLITDMDVLTKIYAVFVHHEQRMASIAAANAGPHSPACMILGEMNEYISGLPLTNEQVGHITWLITRMLCAAEQGGFRWGMEWGEMKGPLNSPCDGEDET